MRRLLFVCSALLLLLAACQKDEYQPTPKNNPPTPGAATADTLFYLALGDSYTKGEGIAFSGNFPSQLVGRFNDVHGDSLFFQIPRVVAQTGWTAGQLLAQTERATFRDRYDFVTLLVGVNNQHQRKPFSDFERDYQALLDFALSRTGLDSSRLLLLSVPDYAYTPFGQNSSMPEQISMEINKYNAYIEQKAQDLGLRFVNITDISRQGLEEPRLLASDQLHPSAEMYALWVERMLPWLEEAVVE